MRTSIQSTDNDPSQSIQLELIRSLLQRSSQVLGSRKSFRLVRYESEGETGPTSTRLTTRVVHAARRWWSLCLLFSVTIVEGRREVESAKGQDWSKGPLQALKFF